MEKIKRIKTNSNINPNVIDDINYNFDLLFSIAEAGDNEVILEKLNTLEESINTLTEKVSQLTSKLTTLESNYTSLESRVTALETPQA